ncbi:MAG: 50S ribosomal protein L29 [Candidatus Sumerlaeia bacterium]|nr:50S ribosomal protein L29 [Candidatus Sumerlaeia bacterium]
MADSTPISAKKLREMTDDELQVAAAEFLRSQFEFRIKSATNDLAQPHLVRVKRRDYARLMTILGERRRQNAAAAEAK